jgi:hypothetical protein
VTEKASRNVMLKAHWNSMEPERVMAFLKAPWKSKVYVKEPTKAEPTEPGRFPMGSEKVQTMAETTEAEKQPKVSPKAQTKGSLKAG